MTPPLISERDAVRRERKAFVAGVEYGAEMVTADCALQPTRQSVKRYPLMVERPRVVRIGQFDYRILNGALSYRCVGEGMRWIDGAGAHIDAYDETQARMAADLFATPNEIVADESVLSVAGDD